MIIWLASYPKSGNTWIRSIICSMLYSRNGLFDFNLLEKIKQFPSRKSFKEIWFTSLCKTRNCTQQTCSRRFKEEGGRFCRRA